jgi:tetratricopeptide (TPR) repeat protein
MVLVLLIVTGVYANHFQNGFHFDDAHTVLDNPYVRSLRNLPRFFTDTATFSVLPANRTYRPIVSASLAFDYALGGGYKPFWFHFSTFLVFLAQLVFMGVLYERVLESVRPAADSTNRIVAVLAVAWYGLHPAIAETVNYVIQRGDVFSTFGVVAALAIFARWRKMRCTGLYLLPLVFAMLSKPPAAVFPLLLFVYIVMFESEEKRRITRAALPCVPAVVVAALLMLLQSAMTPKSYTPSILSASAYRLMQPLVLMRYCASLFLPLHLNVDTDLMASSTVTLGVAFGIGFLALLIACIWFTARRTSTRPIGFGLLWFLIASLPTSLYPLSEVENDHRMFFPFVGLMLAVVASLVLIVERFSRTVGSPRRAQQAAIALSVLLLGCYAYGTCRRNLVWHTDESLWLDDVKKCPHNGRGLMNYGLIQMAQGAYPVALDYFQRALQYTPDYPTLEINLGVVYGAMHQGANASQHFSRALQLAPGNDEVHYYYARWLYQSGELDAAVHELQTAVALNPSRIDQRDLLAEAYGVQGDLSRAHATARDTLSIAPGDPGATRILAESKSPAPNYWINSSLFQYQSGNYSSCIADAKKAIAVQPDSAPAYANLGAGYAGLQNWDLAIQSERDAMRIDPHFTLANNNLALYTRLSAANPAGPRTPEDWLNTSLRDNQAGLYEKSIQDAHAALRLRPDYAEAWNNIAAAYEAMHRWDDAIAAADKALALKPGLQLAKNNLAWSLSQKRVQAN